MLIKGEFKNMSKKILVYILILFTGKVLYSAIPLMSSGEKAVKLAVYNLCGSTPIAVGQGRITYNVAETVCNTIMTSAGKKLTPGFLSYWVSGDTTPPAAVTDFLATYGDLHGSIKLTWSSPGDNGWNDQLNDAVYKIQYSTWTNWQNIVWSTANAQIEISTTNVSPGQLQTYTIYDLTAGVTYYFRMWTRDAVGNWSGMSNGATSVAWVDNIPPARVSDLEGYPGTNVGEVRLIFTVTGNSGYYGNINGGELRIQYTDSLSNAENPSFWNKDNAQYIIQAVYYTAGEQQQVVISNLTAGTVYYFRLWLADEFGNWSDISNGATAQALATPDTTPPSPVTDLHAEPGISNGSVKLTFTATGDDGTQGNIYNGRLHIQYTSSTVSATDPSFWNKDNAQIKVSTTMVANSLQVYIVTSLLPAVTYYFRLWLADDALNFSTISNGATTWAQVVHDTTPPSAVTTLTAQPGPEDGSIELSFYSTGDDGMIGNIVNGLLHIQYTSLQEEAQSPSYWNKDNAQIKISTTMVAGTRQIYVVSNLTAGARYYFRLWLADEVYNFSEMSNMADAKATDKTPPLPPQLVSPQNNSFVTTQRPLFDWTDVTDPSGVYYELQVDNESSGFASLVINQSFISISEYRPTVDLQVGTTYYWRVRAVDYSLNYSSWSSVWQFVIVSTSAVEEDTVPPGKVTTLVAQQGVLPKTIQLSWIMSGDDGYVGDTVGEVKIQYRTTPTGFDKAQAQVTLSTSIVPGEQRSYTFANLVSGVTYYFVLWLRDEAGNWSEMSNISSAVAYDVEDTQPPVVTHTPYSYIGMLGNKIVIFATVRDDVAVKEVVLKYRKKSVDTSYVTAVFKQLQGSTIDTFYGEAEIPVSSVTLSGVEYYIVATDYKDNKGYYKNAGNPQKIDVMQENLFLLPFDTTTLVVPDGNPYDGNTSLEVSDVKIDFDIQINQLDTKLYRGTEDSSIDLAKNDGYPLALYEIRPYGKAFPKPLKFKILYLDVDNDTFIDNTDVSEQEDINMYFYKGNKWELCMNSNKNIHDNTVEAFVVNSGVYGLFVRSKIVEEKYDVRQIQTFVTPEVPLVLPSWVVECRIYNISGNKVISLDKQQMTADRIIWNGKVKDKYVESGVYILEVSPANKEKKYKMIIFAK